MASLTFGFLFAEMQVPVSMPPALASHGLLLICRGMQEGGCRTTVFRRGMPFSSSSQSQIDEASPKFLKPFFVSGPEGPTTTYPSSLWETRVTWPAPGKCHWRVCILDPFPYLQSQEIILQVILPQEAFYPHWCTSSCI